MDIIAVYKLSETISFRYALQYVGSMMFPFLYKAAFFKLAESGAAVDR